MVKLRVMMLVGLMGVALSPLYGCGAECADGTTDRDGQCVIAAKGCSEGTSLRDGECELDTTGCGDNTVLEGGLCVPASEICAGESTFDEETFTCVPDIEVICGEGTEVGSDGRCAPSDEACSATTRLDNNGRCVIAAASCGQGTELDPITGQCILAAAGCGDGQAIDAESNSCVPTDEICGSGTAFDADSGLCLNDSCSLGDVLIDGVCVLPAEDLVADAKLVETENNDPLLGGTPESLVVNPAGDSAYVFTGAIGAPTDLDGDGKVDQDIDVYEFEANAGEWFEITVQSLGLQAPAFIVQGPEVLEQRYVRYSPMGRSSDAARGIVAPVDGVYTLTVLPSMVLRSDGAIAGFGSDDWGYVGTLENAHPPAAAEIDLSSGDAQITGDYLDLSDNLFELTNLQPTDLVRVNVVTSGADADGVLQGWQSMTELSTQQASYRGASVDVSSDSGAAGLLLFDWISIDGPVSDFEATAKIVGTRIASTMPAGASETFTVSADSRQYVVAAQTNTEGLDLDVKITDATTAVVNEGALSSDDELRYLTDAPGDFTIKFTNSTSSSVDATLTAKAVGLPVLGPLSRWDSASYSSESSVPYGEMRLHKVIIDESGALGLSVESTPSYDATYLNLFDSTMTPVQSGQGNVTVSGISPGTYFLEVEPEYYEIDYTVMAGLTGAPDFSSVPNMAIPDDTLPGDSDVLTVSGCSTVSSVAIFVDITHTWRGDIVMSLTNPDGTSVLLHDGTGSSADDLGGWYPVSLTPAEDINAFVGGSGDGDWTLTIGDSVGSDTGTLNEWGLRLGCQ
jgi:subtilisin-like proprotein convertase family protein